MLLNIWVEMHNLGASRYKYILSILIIDASHIQVYLIMY
jgi:hypothetical protein